MSLFKYLDFTRLMRVRWLAGRLKKGAPEAEQEMLESIMFQENASAIVEMVETAWMKALLRGIEKYRKRYPTLSSLLDQFKEDVLGPCAHPAQIAALAKAGEWIPGNQYAMVLFRNHKQNPWLAGIFDSIDSRGRFRDVNGQRWTHCMPFRRDMIGRVEPGVDHPGLPLVRPSQEGFLEGGYDMIGPDPGGLVSGPGGSERVVPASQLRSIVRDRIERFERSGPMADLDFVRENWRPAGGGTAGGGTAQEDAADQHGLIGPDWS